MNRTIISAASVAFLSMVLAPSHAAAQIKGQFSYESLVDCEKPNIKNYPIRGEGTAVLSADSKATLRMRSGLSGYTRIDTKLGEKKQDFRGTTTELRVSGNNSLRATREYTNNFLIAELKFVGPNCRLKIQHKLKPGKKLYTFTTPLGEALCSNIRMTKVECSAL